MGFRRDVYLKRLIVRENNGLIKIITGTRRAGKSYLMNKIFYEYLKNKGVSENQVIKFAFDSDEVIDLLDPFFRKKKTVLCRKTELIW